MSAEDLAQDVELKQWELNNVYRKQMKEFATGDKGYGPEFCEEDDCGAEMPTRRRELGCKLCTDCQSVQERRDKLRARR